MHHEYAPAVQAQLIGLAGGPRKPSRLGEQPHRFGGIVTAEVHGFANLGDRIRQGLAGLLDEDRDQPLAFILELVGHGLENPGTLVTARSVPIPLLARRQFKCTLDFRPIGIGAIAQMFIAVGRIEYGSSGAPARMPEKDGSSP